MKAIWKVERSCTTGIGRKAKIPAISSSTTRAGTARKKLM